MNKKLLSKTFLALTLVTGDASAANGVAVIAHPSVTKLDATTVEKIFTGKVIDVGGAAVVAINAVRGSMVRTRFLQAFLNQDEERYTAYWTVRRYNGLGAPPKEVQSSADVIKLVMSTPGAIGYIDEADVKPGMNVLVAK